MIFVTVGEQLPFDRLIRAVDQWAAGSKKKVFAQTGLSDWKPSNIDHKKFLAPAEFNEKLISADVVISHAGMGTIITALEMGKPIIVMPRQAALHESRNDHQFATAKRFMVSNYVEVAFDEIEILQKLNALEQIVRKQKNRNATSTSQSLIKAIHHFVFS